MGDQTIDREKLGKLVFADKEKQKRIRHHPPTVKAYCRRLRRNGKTERFHLAVEAALLIEDHYDVICDEIWYIYG